MSSFTLRNVDKSGFLWYNVIMNDALKDNIREYYESHRISFANLAKQSERIFGTSITIDQLKKWSQADGGWSKPPISEDEKLRTIADKIYQIIEDDDTLNPRDLTSLANTYLSIITKAPEKVDSNRPVLDDIKSIGEMVAQSLREDKNVD